jgi:hypothetical protein
MHLAAPSRGAERHVLAQLRREQLALHCLGLNGYTTYFPRIRQRRVVRSCKVEVNLPLFPVSARWSVGLSGS